MEIGTKFNNLESYNANMAKGMEDKLWFIQHLIPNKDYVFVDFGCADGTLINILSQIDGFKNARYIGYDVSDSMINLAKSKFSWTSKQRITFTTKWEDVKDIMSNNRGKKILILSSVIHEIYSYCTNKEIENFWNYIKNDPSFDYIFIRDMMCSSDLDRPSTRWDIQMIKDRAWLGRDITKEQLESFETQFGSIENNKNLVHFLLKYRWKINWEREVKENYFSITIEDFLDKIKDKYNINYLERFRVSFLDKCWKEDFNIEIDDNTHIKLFLEKKRC